METSTFWEISTKEKNLCKATCHMLGFGRLLLPHFWGLVMDAKPLVPLQSWMYTVIQ